MHNGVTLQGEKRTGGARAGPGPHRDILTMGNITRLFLASVVVTWNSLQLQKYFSIPNYS